MLLDAALDLSQLKKIGDRGTGHDLARRNAHPFVLSAMAIKVISEVESQFVSSSSFSSPRSVPAGRSRISSICKRNSFRFIVGILQEAYLRSNKNCTFLS